MTLGHEKLDVYRLSIAYIAWVYEKADSLTGVHRPARGQWLRASQSIRLNIAEGDGKTAEASLSMSSRPLTSILLIYQEFSCSTK